MHFYIVQNMKAKNRDDADKELEELGKKDFMLNGSEIKYNDYIYYNMPDPESDFPVQIKNYERGMQVFLPFAEQFRQRFLLRTEKDAISL